MKMIKTKANAKGLILFLLLFVTQAVFASSATDFNDGVRLFKQNQYDKALKAFHLAEKQGLTTVNLYYNIASSYYKKGQYQQAFNYFKKVRQFPKMKTLAEFNLGLTANKMNKTKEADKWFYKVARQNENKKLKILAQQLVGIKPSKKKDKKWSVYSSFSLNAESNPSFSATNTIANKSDIKNEILLVADYRISKKRKNALKAEVAYYRADYSSLNTFDYNEIDVGINKSFSFNKKVALLVSANAKNSTLNTSSYQNVIKLASNLTLLLTKNSNILFGYSYDNINNLITANSYLDGSRHKFKMQYGSYLGKTTHKYIMQYELNNRKDLTSATGTKSYSPSRITLRYKYAKKLKKNWKVAGDISYRLSSYPALSFTARTDNRIKVAGYVDYKFNKTAKLRAKFSYSDNNSTDNTLDYTNSVSSIYFIKTF